MTATETNNPKIRPVASTVGLETPGGAAFARGLTGVGGPEVVRVAGEEGLVVLCRQVHVVVSQRLSTGDPRIPAHTRTGDKIVPSHLC